MNYRFNEACFADDLETAQGIYLSGQITEDIVDKCCDKGCLNILGWFRSLGVDAIYTDCTVNEATIRFLFPVTEHPNAFKYNMDMFEECCIRGQLDTAKHLYIPEFNHSPILYDVCACNRLETAKWLYSVGFTLVLRAEAFELCCLRGHTDVVRWMGDTHPDVLCADLNRIVYKLYNYLQCEYTGCDYNKRYNRNLLKTAEYLYSKGATINDLNKLRRDWTFMYQHIYRFNRRIDVRSLLLRRFTNDVYYQYILNWARRCFPDESNYSQAFEYI